MNSALAFLLLLPVVLRPAAPAPSVLPVVIEEPCARTFILVRHAEKASVESADPDLSEAGVARADRLAWMLQASRATHLFATEFRRTQQTLAPLAKARELEVLRIPARDPSALISALSELPCGAVAVVAGHSNTLPELLSRLSSPSGSAGSGADAFQLTEKDYDRLFVVTSLRTGPASVLELRF
jgi:phosphohistidine phosphatase SixA